MTDFRNPIEERSSHVDMAARGAAFDRLEGALRDHF